ncbi:MAG: sigma 54-interacting transcriptional regulator [Desulfobacterales bacterium]|jgi:PAS domain S-box-containing protein
MEKNELNAYWKTIFNTIQDGVMIVDPDGTIVEVNKALLKMTGYVGDGLIGQSCTTLNCDICKLCRAGEGQRWCNLFETGGVEMRRCTLMRKDGTYIHVLKNASLLEDAAGNVIGAVETMTDISEIMEKDAAIEAYRRELRSADGFHGIIGTTAAMQKVFDLITNAALSDAPVIILGESGTGKELIAKAIHETGGRKDRPFVKVNCAALNESLLESELFGHVKGAFTGAVQGRVGRFEAAAGGDIFLDEIGDLPLSTQVKLLRVLEEKVIERVGDNRPIHVDVRIITATNRDLRKLVREKRFREDLFYRINVVPIIVPPLRERKGDIPLLAETFFRRIRLKSEKPVSAIGSRAMDALMSYGWPGNVRELKSALEYAFVACPGGTIDPQHLPPDVLTAPDATCRPEPDPTLSRGERKRRELIEALRRFDGNQTRTADYLGISRVTVWNRIRKYGLDLQRDVLAPHRQ